MLGAPQGGVNGEAHGIGCDHDGGDELGIGTKKWVHDMYDMWSGYGVRYEWWLVVVVLEMVEGCRLGSS